MNYKICLMLNKHWRPISFCSIYTAVNKIINDRAMMLNYPDFSLVSGVEWMNMISTKESSGILTPRGYLPKPEIVVSKFYDKVVRKNPSCSKKNILKRDGGVCQYTGVKLSKEEITVDHVMPRCRGGATSWDNCVVTSFKLNNKKGPKTPEEVDYTLLKKPSKPIWTLTDYLPEDFSMPESWKIFFAKH